MHESCAFLKLEQPTWTVHLIFKSSKLHPNRSELVVAGRAYTRKAGKRPGGFCSYRTARSIYRQTDSQAGAPGIFARRVPIFQDVFKIESATGSGGISNKKGGFRMMHKIKKATAQATRKIESDNAEFNDYKNRLDSLATYLRGSSAALNESEQAWREVCNRQKKFAEDFTNKYPDKDKVREFGKQSAVASQKLVKTFVLKSEGSQAKHWEVDAVVQEYLAEIAAIAGEYKPINQANVEVQMYTKKVDELQKAKKPDETKIARNMEKLDEAKRQYEEILDRVVEHMKEVYNKRQVALKATYVAYWSSQLRAFNLVDESLNPTREFVSNSVDSICSVKIGSMTPEDIEAFIKANTTPVGAGTATGTAEESGGLKAVPTSPVEPGKEDPAEPTATAI